MNSPNKKVYFCESARPEDGPEILEILEEGGFKGNISILYTRRPDAWESIQKEGDEVEIVLCRDLEGKRILSFGICALREIYINGKPEKAGYYFGLRGRSDLKGRAPVIHRGYEYLHQFGKKRGVKFYFCSVLEENEYARKLLEKKRKIFPHHHSLGTYEVYALGNRKRTKPLPSGYSLKRADEANFDKVVDFINREGLKMQYFPVFTDDDIRNGKFHGLALNDFYALYDEKNRIAAAGALWDQKSYRQYIVKGYEGVYKLIPALSPLVKLLGYPPLAKPGDILEFFTLSFFAVKDNNPEIFDFFVDGISGLRKEYDYFLVGLHSRNPLRESLLKRRHIEYKSRIYHIMWNQKGDPEDLPDVDDNLIPYFECGRL